LRWLRYGLYFLAGVTALLFIAIAVVISIDYGRFKDRIEVEVTDLLGREFRIDGAMHASIGSNIELYVEDVFLANPDWADADAFVSVRKIDVTVNLWSLINGPISVERAEIDGLRVNIEKNIDGQASWNFEGLAAGDDAEPDETDEDTLTSPARIPAILNYVSVTDSRFSFDSAGWDEPLVFIAENLSASISETDFVNTVLVGSLNGTPVRFEQKTGPVANLLEYRDVKVELDGNIGEITIQGSSLIDNVLALRRPQIRFEIKGPNAEYVSEILSTQPFTSGPLTATVNIGDDDDRMAVSIVSVFGEFALDLNGNFDDLQNLNQMELSVSANGPDIGTLVRLSGKPYPDVDPFQLDGRIERDGSNLTIDDVLLSIGESKVTVEGSFAEFPKTNGGRLSLIASGPDYGRFNRLFGLPGRVGGAFTTTLDLSPHQDGGTLIVLAADAPDIQVNVQSKLSANDKFTDSTAQVRITGSDIGKIAETFSIAGVVAEEFEISGFVEKDSDGIVLQDVKAIVGDDVFRIEGHVGENPLSGRTDLEIDFHGSDLGASIVALGGTAENLPKGAYRLQGAVRKDGEKLVLRDLTAVIGDAEDYKFEVSGFITNNPKMIDSEFTVHARGASLSALAELAGVQGIPDYPFDIGAELRRGSATTYIQKGAFHVGNVDMRFSGHISDKPMEHDLEISFDGSVTDLPAVIATFGVAADVVPPGDMIASGTIRRHRGQLSVDNLVASLGDTTLGVSGVVGQPPGFKGTRLNTELRGNDLSQALPARFSRESLDHAFKFIATVVVEDDQLSISELDAEVGHTSLAGSASIMLEPIMGSGRFSLQADSPDLFELFPEAKEISVPQVAKMKFAGSGDWDDNYWKFEDLQLQLGEGSLEIDGALDGPPSFSRTDLNINWHASSIANLSILLGRELPEHALHLTARVVGSRDVMTMENFNLTLGDSDLRGSFTMRDGEIPQVDLDVDSNLLDISEYFEKIAETAADEKVEPESDGRVIPDAPLPLDMLKKFAAEVDIDIVEYRGRALMLDDIELDGTVHSGALRVDKFALTGQREGRIELSASLVPDDSGAAEFNFDAKGSDLIMGMVTDTAEDLEKLPLFEFRSRLSAKGSTVREMAGTLNGYLRMVGGKGEVKAGALAMFTQDFFAQLMSAVNPFSKSDPYTKVDCAVILVRFNDGQIEGSPVVVQQTDKLRIFGNTKIDLKTEKLAATFSTIPQKGLGISVSNLVNPYIKVGGTLKKPSLEIDPEGVLIEGSIAVATAGLSILAKSLKDRFLSEKDPCGKAVTEYDAKYGAPN